MPAPTTTWDETAPPDTQDPKFGAERIRDHKKEERERHVNGDHHWEAVGPATSADAGKHVCADSGATGGLVAGSFTIFESNAHATDRSTPALRIGDGAATPADTVTIGDGSVAAARPYTFDVDDIICNTFDAATSLTTPLSTVTTLTVTGTVVGDLDLDDDFSVTGASVFTGNVDLPDQTTQNIVANTDNTIKNLALTYAGTGVINAQVITTDTPAGKVLIMWRGTWHISYNSAFAPIFIDVELRRDTVQIAEWTNLAQDDGQSGSPDARIPITLIWLDEAASDGTAHTYDIRALHNTNSVTASAFTISQRALIVSEYRNDIP